MVKNVSPVLQAHLDGRATTMAYCWKVTRNDGLTQGFTDHDRSLSFGGLTYEAATGFTASQAATSLGLAVDNFEVTGALSSSSINEVDLAAGHYDNATVEVYWVNWSSVQDRHLVSRGFIGEVKRQGVTFVAEMRGLANALQQKVGRSYQRSCDAIVGDPRCGVDLTNPLYYGLGTVSSSSSSRQLTATGLVGFQDGWFSSGLLTWLSGNNSSASMEVKFHGSLATGTTQIELWQAMPSAILPSDTFRITVGCSQDAKTCNSKFSNIANFRGFNLIPGPDMLLFYPKAKGSLNGGSLFNY